MAKLLISDGYTLDGLFVGTRFGLPNVAFKFRYATPEAVFDYQQKVGRAATGRDQVKAIGELLVGRIASWDIEDEKGESVPVSAEILRRLPTPLLNHLADSVCAYLPAQQADDAKN